MTTEPGSDVSVGPQHVLTAVLGSCEASKQGSQQRISAGRPGLAGSTQAAHRFISFAASQAILLRLVLAVATCVLFLHSPSVSGMMTDVHMHSRGQSTESAAPRAGELPLWARIYIRGTRFYDAHRDQWFAVFEPATEQCRYASRRAAIVEKLGSMYSRDDVVKVSSSRRANDLCSAGPCAAQEGVSKADPVVPSPCCRARLEDAQTAPTSAGSSVLSHGGALQIASLLRAGASDDALAAAWVPLVCSRLIAGGDVPPDVTKAARSCLNTPADILRYNAGASVPTLHVGFCMPGLLSCLVLRSACSPAQ